jgi:hypothetical protein
MTRLIPVAPAHRSVLLRPATRDGRVVHAHLSAWDHILHHRPHPWEAFPSKSPPWLCSAAKPSCRPLSNNRERLLNKDVFGAFLEKLMGSPEVKPLLSEEHFSVDGTLLAAWASHASLVRIDGKGDFRGVKLSNDTHRSTTDPEALLARKSNAHPAQLSYRGHVLMENRDDLVVDCRVTLADGFGERDAAKEMAADHPGARRKTIGADKNDDTKDLSPRGAGLGSHLMWRKTPHATRAIQR